MKWNTEWNMEYGIGLFRKKCVNGGAFFREKNLKIFSLYSM